MKKELTYILIVIGTLLVTNFANYFATKSVWYNRGMIDTEKIWLAKLYAAQSVKDTVYDTIIGKIDTSGVVQGHPILPDSGDTAATDPCSKYTTPFETTIKINNDLSMPITAYPIERSFVYDIIGESRQPFTTITETKYVPMPYALPQKHFWIATDAIYFHDKRAGLSTVIGYKTIGIGRIFIHKQAPATVLRFIIYF